MKTFRRKLFIKIRQYFKIILNNIIGYFSATVARFFVTKNIWCNYIKREPWLMGRSTWNMVDLIVDSAHVGWLSKPTQKFSLDHVYTLFPRVLKGEIVNQVIAESKVSAWSFKIDTSIPFGMNGLVSKLIMFTFDKILYLFFLNIKYYIL